MENFEKFLTKEGLERFLPEHRAANKPTKEIEERYYRTAKVLLDIGGTGQGEDSFHWNATRTRGRAKPLFARSGGSLPRSFAAERRTCDWRPGEGFSKVRPE